VTQDQADAGLDACRLRCCDHLLYVCKGCRQWLFAEDVLAVGGGPQDEVLMRGRRHRYVDDVDFGGVDDLVRISGDERAIDYVREFARPFLVDITDREISGVHEAQADHRADCPRMETAPQSAAD